jgi:phage shock protein E
MKFTCLLLISAALLVCIGLATASEEGVAVTRQLVIDVRTEQDWKDGHLNGAILIPHDRIEQGIAAVTPGKKSRIYLYCRSGRRTALAQDVLEKAGYRDIVNLGTMENASRELKMPIVK